MSNTSRQGRFRLASIGALALACLMTNIALPAQAEPPVERLPEWFEGNRVQAHSESSLEIALRITPEGHARSIRSLGAHVLTRMFLSIGEGAWWPTRVGRTNPLIGERDFAAELIRAGHAEGLRLIGYYRHMCDQAMQAEHSEWICRKPDGTPALEVRGKRKDLYVLCMNSPYREYTKTRLLELADRGLDAIYFDSWHMPDICACDYCKKTFRAETGHDMDLSAAVGSPGYMEIVAFVNRTMVQTFTEWHRAIRAKHPDVFLAIGSSQYPMFISPHIDEHLLAISNTSKTEFHKPFGHEPRAMSREPDFATPAFDDQLALGWSLVRDASGGRPPLMWIPFLTSEKTATYSAAAAVTYGCIASLQAVVRNLDEDTSTNQKMFRSVFAMGDRVSPHLAYTRPVPWAALHISERARNARVGDMKQLWREVFTPALGACQALKECHAPWVVLTDDALAAGPSAETRLLVLPWPADLTAEQKNAVARFEQRGGRIIRLDPKAGWHTRTSRPGLLKPLREAIRQQASGWPIRITGPERMHAMCFRHPTEKRYTICLTNTWAWFRSERETVPSLKQQPEQPPCSDVTISLSPALGRPRKVFEADTGATLETEPADSRIRVRVPTFQVFACVVVRY
ncbi:MAG TPA: hypothetical protein VLM89_10745 [Phycisphaerae bacterium]|nr:hypothetical protein [Phycisphaerae bacterium]